MLTKQKEKATIKFSSEEKKYTVYTAVMGSSKFQYIKRLNTYYLVVKIADTLYKCVRPLTYSEVKYANPYIC